MVNWMPILALVLLASAAPECLDVCIAGYCGPDCLCISGIGIPLNAAPALPKLFAQNNANFKAFN
jgi:hypothetical protein